MTDDEMTARHATPRRKRYNINTKALGKMEFERKRPMGNIRSFSELRPFVKERTADELLAIFDSVKKVRGPQKPLRVTCACPARAAL